MSVCRETAEAGRLTKASRRDRGIRCCEAPDDLIRSRLCAAETSSVAPEVSVFIIVLATKPAEEQHSLLLYSVVRSKIIQSLPDQVFIAPPPP